MTTSTFRFLNQGPLVVAIKLDTPDGQVDLPFTIEETEVRFTLPDGLDAAVLSDAGYALDTIDTATPAPMPPLSDEVKSLLAPYRQRPPKATEER